MRLIAIGGDMRMNGAVRAAKRAGWEALRITNESETIPPGETDAVLLPWPVSFRDDRLVCAPPGEAMEKERVLRRIPPCSLILHGAGFARTDAPQAEAALDPSKDEAFLRKNARLTAEGALCTAMRSGKSALLESTCLITGFGRIGQELTARLCAMGAFVIVCARSETQMRAAHQMGAHPVPLEQLARVAGQANLLFNTVPARVLGEDVLRQIGREALLIELASAPYGADVEEAARLGVNMRLESGLPGRYAPNEAGEALFEAVQRALTGAQRAQQAARRARQEKAAPRKETAERQEEDADRGGDDDG